MNENCEMCGVLLTDTIDPRELQIYDCAGCPQGPFCRRCLLSHMEWVHRTIYVSSERDVFVRMSLR